jgi:outer membrane immunogenic protein
MRKTTLLSLMGSLIAFAPAALAADIPARPVYKSPAAVVAATHNWTGIYVGGHAGYGWAKVKGNDEFGDPGSGDLDGFIGGGQVGANYQIGNVVLGVEGEYSYSDVKKEISLVPFFGAGDLKVRNEYYITATGRLGYAFDRVLVYAKGGAAWTREKWDVNDGVGGAITGRFSRTGWLVGGGAEWMIFGNWSAKVECNYVYFGEIDETAFTSTSAVLATGGATGVTSANHLIKGGINYRF